MQHDQRRFHSHRGFNRLQRVPKRVFAFARIVGRKLEDIRRGMIDAHRQGTEIVQAGNLHLTRVDGFQHSGQQADANAVAQFRVIKAKVTDLAQHGSAVGMAMRIPAGGE